VSGNSTINQGGNTTTINQKSQNTQINWQKFNVAKNETVNFVQPNKSAVALNKVVGNDASAIYGNLNANGQVFLVNPNGILFGKTASVNVGGLVASTLDIKANENGKYTFEGSGGTITNEGNLKANGNLVLAASIVNNQGTITNNSGTTQLVAADKITLDTGEAYTITVDKGALNAQINNGGAIYGNDGKVYLTAKGRDSLSNAVINHTGVIEANAVKTGAGGKIILLSDMAQVQQTYPALCMPRVQPVTVVLLRPAVLR
jgi:filamentous hemagglutinin family protein